LDGFEEDWAMLCQSGDCRRKGQQIGSEAGYDVVNAPQCLSKCEKRARCNIATYNEEEQLCKLYTGTATQRAEGFTRRSVRCERQVSGWVVYAKVTVVTPPDTDILQVTESEEEVQEDVQCYLWTQTLIDMIKKAEDSSGEHTNFLPEAGTVIPAESLKLLPSDQWTLKEFEESGFLERC